MIIKVKVRPGSSWNGLEEVDSGEFIAHLKAQPEKGRANLELIKLLAKHFRIPTTNVKIKTPTSRNKLVEILQ